MIKKINDVSSEILEGLAARRQKYEGDLPDHDGLCDPDCPVCSGSGWTRSELYRNHPNFGELELCQRIDPWKLPHSRRIGITKDETLAMTWDHLVDVGDASKAREIVKRAHVRGHGWVFLYGGHGLAKTLILKMAIAEYVRAGAFNVAYTRMAEIIDNLRASFDTDTPSMESDVRLGWWSEIPLLAIDEFDRVRGTEYADERRFVLMDRRYESAIRGESVTILASNISPDKLPPYLSDRVMDGRFEVVRLQGDSLRPGMKWEK